MGVRDPTLCQNGGGGGEGYPPKREIFVIKILLMNTRLIKESLEHFKNQTDLKANAV